MLHCCLLVHVLYYHRPLRNALRAVIRGTREEGPKNRHLRTFTMRTYKECLLNSLPVVYIYHSKLFLGRCFRAIFFTLLSTSHSITAQSQKQIRHSYTLKTSSCLNPCTLFRLIQLACYLH